MGKQQTFSVVGFDTHHRGTKRDAFLTGMDTVIPWKKLCAVIAPVYPKAGKGRHPRELEQMLRIHFLQHWFNLSDPGVEEALYDSLSMRKFARIDLGSAPVPDETTICKFRHLLEQHGLSAQILKTVNNHLQQAGVRISSGTIVDATMIAAPSSTRNASGQRDPEMHQTKKGNQWYFGMKGHIGVDTEHGLIHSADVTAANVHDSQVLPELLRGTETRVYGDSAYRGQKDVINEHAPKAKDFTQYRAYRNRPLTEKQVQQNRTKSSVRSVVEHLFRIIKVQFGFTKVRYKGLHKNAERWYMVCALANLYQVRTNPRLRLA